MSISLDIQKLFIRPQDSIKLAAECINRNQRGLAALVVDGQQKLLDIVTDGDIRRAILDGISLDTHVATLRSRKAQTAFPTAVVASASLNKAELLVFMRMRGIQQVPLVDAAGRVVDLVKLSDLLPNGALAVQAVVMAGGLGTRLRPLTTDLPKPMLPVGDRPLLELTIENLKTAGIQRVSVTTHFRPEKIREHFGDGREFGVEISYLNEDTPLGTAGALALMEDAGEPLLVINGDILTQVDYRSMMGFHRDHRADLTVAVRQYDLQVPYGVLECDGPYVQKVREKPVYNYFVSAGIYILEPSVRKLIPRGRRFDMPDLINSLIESKHKVVSFPVVEYWLDIGQHVDYAQAQEDVEAGRFDK
jgi:dTDP-glucose pyrophosphorylase/CBS domain-containing protein